MAGDGSFKGDRCWLGTLRSSASPWQPVLHILFKTGSSAELLALSHLIFLPRNQVQLGGGTGDDGKLDRGVEGRRLLLATQGGLPSQPWKPDPLLR